MALSDNFISEAAKAGVKAGVKSVTGDVLNSAGKALLESISPELSSLLFGGSSGPSPDTKLILDKLNELNSGLSERLRNISDQNQDIFDSEIKGSVSQGIGSN